MLGDSATAHFHIPPQWMTANGWNLDGILPFLTNEMVSIYIYLFIIYLSNITINM
jgi:hypothetical protein